MLGPGLYRMFAPLPGQYKRHGLNVYYRAKAAGCDDPVVLQAALLHDAGKFDPYTGRYVTIVHRVAVVLLEAVPAGRSLLGRLSARTHKGIAGYLLHPFYLSKRHEELGARTAEQLGASPEVVSLIARHSEAPGSDARLRALQAADDKS